MHNADRLTNQECQVLRALLSGATNRELADQLFVSVKTVETHLTRIYRKLGCRSRVQVITSYHRGDLSDTVPDATALNAAATRAWATVTV